MPLSGGEPLRREGAICICGLVGDGSCVWLECGARDCIPGASGGGGSDTPPDVTVPPGAPIGATWLRFEVGADCGKGASLPALEVAFISVAGQIVPVAAAERRRAAATNLNATPERFFVKK